MAAAMAALTVVPQWQSECGRRRCLWYLCTFKLPPCGCSSSGQCHCGFGKHAYMIPTPTTIPPLPNPSNPTPTPTPNYPPPPKQNKKCKQWDGVAAWV
jgi:hypothetical protein